MEVLSDIYTISFVSSIYIVIENTLKNVNPVSYIFPMNCPNGLPDKIVFIADAHLGMPGDIPERARHLESFLASLRGTVSHLYILGDLFDFWFEYRTVVPVTAPGVIFHIHDLVRSGVEVSLLAGNHDYWSGPYLRDGIGMKLYPDGLSVAHQGRKIYMHHGDGLYPRDHGYRILKKGLRNSFIISMFRLIHPDWAAGIARVTSSTSRKYLAPPPGRDNVYADLFRDIADIRLSEGYDAAVYGHSHVALNEKRDKGTLVLLGDWINRSTYAVLENGEFSLHEWKSEDHNRHV